MNQHYQVVIVGGGTAGITVASRILRQKPDFKGNISIIDPLNIIIINLYGL